MEDLVLNDVIEQANYFSANVTNKRNRKHDISTAATKVAGTILFTGAYPQKSIGRGQDPKNQADRPANIATT